MAKQFLCSYRFQGVEYGFKICADSHSDAEARLKALPWAHVDGEVMAEIRFGGGWLDRLLAWVRT